MHLAFNWIMIVFSWEKNIVQYKTNLHNASTYYINEITVVLFRKCQNHTKWQFFKIWTIHAGVFWSQIQDQRLCYPGLSFGAVQNHNSVITREKLPRVLSASSCSSSKEICACYDLFYFFSTWYRYVYKYRGKLAK